VRQFAGDRGKKEASKEVGEEKRKEKEALRVEREKEVEEKRKHDEEVLKQQQEVVKARAVIAGPVQVGKIDLNPKKAAAVAAPVINPEVPPIVAAKWKHRKQKLRQKSQFKKVQEKLLLIRKR
jgi:translation initiation factor IF-2